MSLHAGQEKKVIARTNNYSKSDFGKGPSSKLCYNSYRPISDAFIKRIDIGLGDPVPPSSIDNQGVSK